MQRVTLQKTDTTTNAGLQLCSAFLVILVFVNLTEPSLDLAGPDY